MIAEPRQKPAPLEAHLSPAHEKNLGRYHPEAAEKLRLFRCGRSWSSANSWRDRAGFIEFLVSSRQG